MAQAGAAANVTTTFTNTGVTAVRDVDMRLDLPSGWSATAPQARD